MDAETQSYLSDKADVIYMAGCRTSYNNSMWNTARSNIRLASQAGLKINTLAEETCCGTRAYQMGYKDDAIRQAKETIALIRKTGCQTIVTGCAECYHAFNTLYPKLGLDIGVTVQHTSQLFADLIEKGALSITSPVEMTITYHDPCYLGRQGEDYIPWEGKRKPGHVILYDPPKEYRRGHGGVYDQPRDILSKIPGVNLVEMPRTKEYAWCCGAGGGVSETNPEFAGWTAMNRIEEAALTGANAIVSACPGCEALFKRTVSQTNIDLEVYDLTDILTRATA